MFEAMRMHQLVNRQAEPVVGYAVDYLVKKVMPSLKEGVNHLAPDVLEALLVHGLVLCDWPWQKLLARFTGAVKVSLVRRGQKYVLAKILGGN
jgi:hypothetical protein